MFDFLSGIGDFFGSVSDFLFTDSGIGNIINPLIGAGIATFAGGGGSGGGGGRTLVAQAPKVPDFSRLPISGQPGSPTTPGRPSAARPAGADRG